MTRLVLFLFVALTLVGCVPRTGAPGSAGAETPEIITAVLPGQSLNLRLEDGGTAVVTAGQPYVSALGERCVRVAGYTRGRRSRRS